MQNEDMPSWIAVECNALKITAWHVSEQGEVLDKAQSTGAQSADREEQVLSLIDAWVKDKNVIDVVSCGWDTSVSRLTPVPCDAFNVSRLQHVFCKDKRLNVHDVAGLRQAEPHDILRSEVMQIAGYLAQYPKFDGVIVLPNLHSRWVRVSAEEIVSFESYMTGELYELLVEKSSLQQAVGSTWDDAIFDGAVSEALSKPEKLAARFLGIQSQALLSGSTENSAAYLSGLLIGAEIASTRPYWLGQDVVVLGNFEASPHYLRALNTQGAMARACEIQDTTLLGLAVARKGYHESISKL